MDKRLGEEEDASRTDSEVGTPGGPHNTAGRKMYLKDQDEERRGKAWTKVKRRGKRTKLARKLRKAVRMGRRFFWADE